MKEAETASVYQQITAGLSTVEVRKEYLS